MGLPAVRRLAVQAISFLIINTLIWMTILYYHNPSDSRLGADSIEPTQEYIIDADAEESTDLPPTDDEFKQSNSKMGNRLGFDHIFVITLPSAFGRINRTRQIIDYHGLDVEYWLAETPESHNTKTYIELKPQGDSEWKDHWTKRVSCFATHMAIYQEIVRKNYTDALILEDDIDMEMDIKDRMENVMKSVREVEWDMLYPGYCYPSGQMKASIYSGWMIYEKVYCTHAYAISNQFAKTFIGENTAPTKPIDLMLQDRCGQEKCRRYALLPQVFGQLPKDIAGSTLGSMMKLENQNLQQSTFVHLKLI